MVKKSRKITISALIIAKNENKMLTNCLKSVAWCDEIIVVDNGSTDDTVSIAENFGAKVIAFKHQSFARLREEALKRVKTDWLFYVDADERVTPTLAKEILVQIETCDCVALKMNRKNICYGQKFKYGGWEKDFVTRIFKKEALKGWQGDIHESPVFEGKVDDLQSTLIHLTHRNTIDNMKKTVEWTKMEADLLFKANVPKVKFSTLIRKGFMEFWRRAIIWKGHKDGMAGLVEALVQGINKVLIYIQVWEMQQTPSLDKKYEKEDLKIQQLWQEEK